MLIKRREQKRILLYLFCLPRVKLYTTATLSQGSVQTERKKNLLFQFNKHLLSSYYAEGSTEDAVVIQRCGSCVERAHSRIKSWYSKKSNHSQMRRYSQMRHQCALTSPTTTHFLGSILWRAVKHVLRNNTVQWLKDQALTLLIWKVGMIKVSSSSLSHHQIM